MASVLEAVPHGPGEDGAFLGSKPSFVLQLLGNGLMSVGSGQYLYQCILYAMLNMMGSYPPWSSTRVLLPSVVLLEPKE